MVGARGPRRAPTEITKLRGNPQKRPGINEILTGDVPLCIPEPPDWLDDVACEEWAIVSPFLWEHDLLTSTSVTTLAVYCQAVSNYVAAQREIAEHGFLIPSTRAGQVRNPALAAATQAAGVILRYAAEFGLTPSSLAALHKRRDEGPKAIDLSDILNQEDEDESTPQTS
jgi:P27 family predicted phage terminase small subunit